MKSPHSLSDEELCDYADHHLSFEIDMLLWSSGVMATLGSLKQEGLLAWACNSAMLNTFALHSRNLTDFLYLRASGRDRKTDIIVQDYIDEATLSNHLPPITPLLEEAKKKADKQAAHLSLDRIQYEQSGKGWQFINIATDIMTAFRAIAPVFPGNRISDSLRQRLLKPDLMIPQVATEVIRIAEEWPVGVAFRCNAETTEQGLRVICHRLSD